MQRLEILTGQLALVGGERRERSPLITIAEPDGLLTPEAHKGRLYVLIEANMELARAPQACQTAARTIRREFYADTTYSVTSALRAALRAANKAIYELNIGQPAQQRVQVGCTCAVIKDGELYLALVQPAQTYILSDGQLRPIPAHPSWNPAHLSAAPFVHSGALGASLFIEPELFRSDFGANSQILICPSRISHVLRKADAQRLLEISDPEEHIAALAEFAGAHEILDLHALAIKVRKAAPKPLPLPEAEREPHRERMPGILGAVLSRLRGSPEPASPAAPRPDPLHTLPEQPSYSPTPPPRPTPIDLGESLTDRYERNRREKPQPAPSKPRPQWSICRPRPFSVSRITTQPPAPSISAMDR
ncbi:MAG: hypothetical protein HC822_05715 [Oscillochloris sp.]|nr:hypothetical protein [Oscillochloris sp.]